MKNSMNVRISVVGGVAYVDQVPAGVTVEVTDYDVDARSPERDENGSPCSRYKVEAPATPEKRSSDGIDSYAIWEPDWKRDEVA